MVSFQCEGCGDVQTKKKLDSHRNQCHAPFTCIDCMTTFQGTGYRAHTSCMTEAQKYEGHLYREKPTKASKRKSVSILEPNENNALVRHQPTVQDEELEIPPQVPTPPPAVTTGSRDSVFDYLVDEDPDTPQIQFASEREEMSLKRDAPSVFGGSRPTSRNSSRDEYRNKEERLESRDYQENGFTYGAEPVNPRPTHPNASSVTLDFMTPAAKAAKAKLDRGVPQSAGHSRQSSNSEKKRKRPQSDDHSGDVSMTDAPGTIVRSVVDTPGAVNHSGLTGGLQRMLQEEDDDDWGRLQARSPPSSPNPERDSRALTKLKPVKSLKNHQSEPQSPLKRTRRSKDADDAGLGISIKGRAGRVMSMIGGALSTHTESELGKPRRRGSSSDAREDKILVRGRDGDRRERKKHKVTRHNGTSSANVRMERSSRSKKRQGSTSPDIHESKNGSTNGKQKAIEYHSSSHHRSAHSPSDSDADRGGQQMVVFGEEERRRRKCDDFLAYITKGPGSEKGYSINKVLKRYHRDSEITKENDKREEEKDLWKGLRLKRNDRGEVVVFFA
ncbi:hypothetical protein LTR64_008485 [Lithohypha guttulata]|uniref:uncharacterized protein n=1 Tax=Lithohypha guttulata TaxID=1690604 RepID=UPI002DE17855|nr:hypothetical protein LTR51_001750 [Lithohypha guttulata]